MAQTLGAFSDDSASSEEATTSVGTGESSDVVMADAFSSETTSTGSYYDSEFSYHLNLSTSQETAAPLFVPDLQLEEVMHPSLNGIYESFMASRKRKFPF